jgi:hypothetical protein
MCILLINVDWGFIAWPRAKDTGIFAIWLAAIAITSAATCYGLYLDAVSLKSVTVSVATLLLL